MVLLQEGSAAEDDIPEVQLQLARVRDKYFILTTLPLIFHLKYTMHISAAVPVAPNKQFLVYPSGSYGVSGSQQPQNTNFDQNLPIGAL